MQFFIPHAEESSSDPEQIYAAIVEFAEEQSGWKVQDRRIYSLEYHHEGKRYTARVGEYEPRTREEVIAILRSVTYLVCTPKRGVARGEAMMVGMNEVDAVIDFDKPIDS